MQFPWHMLTLFYYDIKHDRRDIHKTEVKKDNGPRQCHWQFQVVLYASECTEQTAGCYRWFLRRPPGPIPRIRSRGFGMKVLKRSLWDKTIVDTWTLLVDA